MLRKSTKPNKVFCKCGKEYINIGKNGVKKMDCETSFYIPRKRECLYICGSSGSGKSTYASLYAQKYRETHKKAKIFLFSRKLEDPALDMVKPIRIMINDSLLQPIPLTVFKNSLIIFDDIDSLCGPIRKAIYQLIDEILFDGRCYKISIIVTAHLPSNYKETRGILNECTSYTIFPNSGTNYKRLYSEYMDLSKDQVQEIKNLPSRWVTIYNNYPRRVLHQKGCYLL